MELPIFQDNLRSSGGWAAAVTQARDRWQALKAAPEQAAASESQVRAWQADQTARRLGGQGREAFAAEFADAARRVSSWAADAAAQLSVPQLVEINRALSGGTDAAGTLRRGNAGPLTAAHEPAPAALLPRLLENAFDWFATEGFAEMNPVEQAALVYLRLLDLHPFAAAPEQTALLAASFYVERAGLPPLVLGADEDHRQRYAAALAAAFRMLTQPLVELFADSLVQTVKRMSLDFEIRSATIGDVPLILDFIKRLAEYERLAHEVVATEDGLRTALFGERPLAEVIIGFAAGQPAGFALFFHNFSTFVGKPGIYLEDLFVDERYRGQGYGKALLAHLAKLAIQRGCGRLEWAVLNWNEPAIRFYRRLGAVPMTEWTVNRVTGEALARLAG